MEFPFLIGRIRTIILKKAVEDTKKFPFLIGRIRTKYNLLNKLMMSHVSIPHR